MCLMGASSNFLCDMLYFDCFEKIIFQFFFHNYLVVKRCIWKFEIFHFCQNWPIFPICGPPGEKLLYSHFLIAYDDSRFSRGSICYLKAYLCSFFLIPQYAHVTFIYHIIIFRHYTIFEIGYIKSASSVSFFEKSRFFPRKSICECLFFWKDMRPLESF